MRRSEKGSGCAHRLVSTVVAVALFGGAWLPMDASASPAPVKVTSYTSPAQALAWGQKSHWKQPWRSYLDTVPATTLLNAIGINFNVRGTWAATTAKLLGDSGFTRARIEVPWGAVNFENPSTMNATSLEELTAKLVAMRENGIRPLILLNGNHSKPCPVKNDTIELTSAAHAGDTAIHVNPQELGKIAVNRSGISSGGVAAQYLFSAKNSNGTVQLSAPLGTLKPANDTGIQELASGSLEFETLRYEPFRSAVLENGAPNPAFNSSLQGWLNYVHVVTREAESILGSENFDVEVWNELSFGSRFLSINNYYEPDLEYSNGANPAELLAKTVEYIRNPANGVPNIGIGDGFANQTPWPSAANTPVGLSAIDKHPYPSIRFFPQQAVANGNRPLNGLGEPAGAEVSPGQWRETFTPSYTAFFPEYYLSGIQTETLVHDLSPTTSKVGSIDHGRFVHAPGGQPTAEWITEFNLNPTSGPVPASAMTPADIRHIESKIVLRSLVTFVNKGVTALDFYAANSGNFSLINSSFFAALKGPNPAYPGDAAGGETMEAVSRMVKTMQGAQQISLPHTLSLRELTDFSSNKQFNGNGTAQYPPLYNRDVLAFLPFQVTAHRFVIPLYVMTRNVATIYNSNTDPSRFDMPEEQYELDIGGVNGKSAEVSATDPLNGNTIPVQVVARTEQGLKVNVGVTDSPRLLTIQEPESTASPSTTTTEPVTNGKHGGNQHSGQVVVEAQASASARPRFALRNRRALLDKRQMLVIARFRAPYTLRVRGSLTVAGRHYPLRPGRNAGVMKVQRQGPASVPLKLRANTAQAASRALEQGKPVRLAVSVGAQPDSGNAQFAQRSWPVRP
jgi:hypothetical protein